MAETVAADAVLSARLRRALELIYGVEGVIGAQIWEWPGRVAVGATCRVRFPQPTRSVAWRSRSPRGLPARPGTSACSAAREMTRR